MFKLSLTWNDRDSFQCSENSECSQRRYIAQVHKLCYISEIGEGSHTNRHQMTKPHTQDHNTITTDQEETSQSWSTEEGEEEGEEERKEKHTHLTSTPRPHHPILSYLELQK